MEQWSAEQSKAEQSSWKQAYIGPRTPRWIEVGLLKSEIHRLELAGAKAQGDAKLADAKLELLEERRSREQERSEKYAERCVKWRQQVSDLKKDVAKKSSARSTRGEEAARQVEKRLMKLIGERNPKAAKVEKQVPKPEVQIVERVVEVPHVETKDSKSSEKEAQSREKEVESWAKDSKSWGNGQSWGNASNSWDQEDFMKVGAKVEGKFGSTFWECEVLAIFVETVKVRWSYDGSETKLLKEDIRELKGLVVGAKAEAKYGYSWFEVVVIALSGDKAKVKWNFDGSEAEVSTSEVRSKDGAPGLSQWAARRALRAAKKHKVQY